MNTKNIEQYLKCIKCVGNLKVEHLDDGEGIIFCSKCGEGYPIIKNIPRLLSGELLANCYYFYYDIIKTNKVLKEYFQNKLYNIKVQNEIEKLKSATQKQFGYEWYVWSKLPDFAENHFFEVMDKPNNFFYGKLGWDPAIGNGRDLFNAAKAVGDKGMMVGSDLSFSVDVAYERCKNLNNILIVQADLYSDFLQNNSLDFAYMIGLIQHLTEPQKGIEQVYKKVSKGGYFVGTVYTTPKDLLSKFVVSFIYFMRVFTPKLPLPIVLFISRLCALPAYLFFKLPNFILNKFKYVQDMNKLYHTHQTQKGKPDLNLIAHN